jgi:hypothetical protein
MKPNQVYWISSQTPHGPVGVEEDDYRMFLAGLIFIYERRDREIEIRELELY